MTGRDVLVVQTDGSLGQAPNGAESPQLEHLTNGYLIRAAMGYDQSEGCRVWLLGSLPVAPDLAHNDDKEAVDRDDKREAESKHKKLGRYVQDRWHV